MTITFELLIQLGVGVVTLAGFAWGIVSWITAQFAIRDAGIARLRQDALEQITRARDELGLHKLHAAETFATRAGVTESLDRVFSAIDKLTGRIDEMLRLERRKDDQ